MSTELENAIQSINTASDRTTKTTEFVDQLSTYDDTSDVTNPNTGVTVPSLQKKTRLIAEAAFAGSETKINQAVYDAELAALAAQSAANYDTEFVVGVTSAIKGKSYLYDGSMWACLNDTTETPAIGNVNWHSLANHNSLTNRDDADAHPASAINTEDGRTVQKRFDDLPNEVDSAGTANTLIAQHDLDTTAHKDIRNQVQADIDVRLLAISTMVQGRLAFATKADMLASQSHPENTIAEVWNDSVLDNNGLYGFTSGSWVKSPFDVTRVIQDSADMAFNLSVLSSDENIKHKLLNVRQYMVDLLPEEYKTQMGDYTRPLVIDDEGNVAASINSKGELLCQLAPEVLKMFNWVYADPNLTGYVVAAIDAAGNVAAGISKEGTINAGRYKIYDALTPSTPNVVFSLQDKEGNSALTVFDDGVVETIKNNQTPMIAEINQVVLHGQSLSLGSQGYPVISTSQPYHNLMFSGGPRIGGSNWSVDYDRLTTMSPLIETEDGILGETCLSGALNYATELYRDEEGITPTADLAMFGVSVGVGDTSILSLGKDAAGWSRVSESVVYANLRASEVSKTHAVQAMLWMQGEHDSNQPSLTQQTYVTKLSLLQRDFSEFCKSITKQKHTVPLITYQLSYRSAIPEGRKIPLGHLEAAKKNKNIHIAAPTYMMPHFDLVHMTNVGYKWYSHYFGRVIKKLMNNEPWRPLEPLSTLQTGRSVVITFNVPEPPLVIDETQLGASTPQNGFFVEDEIGLVNVNSVGVISGNRVKLTLDRDIVGHAVVRYGLDQGRSNVGIRDAATGDLRDSAGDKDQVDIEGNNYRLDNWCLHFEVEIN